MVHRLSIKTRCQARIQNCSKGRRKVVATATAAVVVVAAEAAAAAAAAVVAAAAAAAAATAVVPVIAQTNSNAFRSILAAKFLKTKTAVHQRPQLEKDSGHPRQPYQMVLKFKQLLNLLQAQAQAPALVPQRLPHPVMIPTAMIAVDQLHPLVQALVPVPHPLPATAAVATIQKAYLHNGGITPLPRAVAGLTCLGV